MQITSTNNESIQASQQLQAKPAIQNQTSAEDKPNSQSVTLSTEAQQKLKAEQNNPAQKVANLENELFSLYDQAIAKGGFTTFETEQDKQLNALIAKQEYQAVDKLSPEQKQQYSNMADEFANLYKSVPGGDKLIADLQKIKNPLERIDKMFEATANMPVSEAFIAKEEQLFSKLGKASDTLNVTFSPEQQKQLDQLSQKSEQAFNQQLNLHLDDKQKTRVAQLTQMLDKLYQTS